MIQTLLDYYNQFMTISKSNPIAASVIALYGAGILTYLMRNIPNKIWNTLVDQLTTSLEFTNSGWDYSDLQFKAFMEWYGKQPWARFSRSLSLNVKNWEGDCFVSAGVGNHYFLYKGRIFKIARAGLESGGVDREKHKITITGLTRSHTLIDELVSEFRYRKNDNEISIKRFTNGWETQSVITKRDLNTVIINQDDKAELLGRIEQFMKDETWYKQRGIPYKLTIILHGKPGTGKSSLIKALASHYERNLCLLNLAQLSDTAFETAMCTVGDNSFVLIEDFDSTSAVKSREPQPRVSLKEGQPDEVTAVSVSPAKFFEVGFLTLSGVLNAMDGVVSLDGTITFLTTNHLETIDPALLRKGRVDLIMEIKYFQHAEVCQYIQLMFPDQSIPAGIEFNPIPGCDLQDLFKVHRDDFLTFLSHIPHKPLSDRVVPIRTRVLEVKEH